ncbi:MAG TPA: tetratricopeptide repeat protein [Burkholderiales bacterium]|nr:tetratricopeptide repeat protein [Burkholderiales bacterium]
MSAYTEQEELEKFKAWWKEYGTSIVVGVALGVIMLAGYRYWVQHQETQREAASTMYEQLIADLRTNRTQSARDVGAKLVGEYSSTPYAGMAALLLARQAYDAGDLPAARQHLEWAVTNAKGDATRHAARLRLARMLLAANDSKAAAAVVDVKDIAGFEAEYHELKGDVALAQGDKETARKAYQEASKALPPNSPYRSALSMKLDDVGSEKP